MNNDNNNNNTTNLTNSNNNTSVEQEVNTIKATDLKNNLNSNEKRDLSAIIPTESYKGEEANDLLISRDTSLKSDGAVVIGNIDAEGVKIVEGASFPKEIDIEARKKAQQAAIKEKKAPNKKKKTISEDAKKAQNITTIIVLIVIAFLGAFGYLFINRKTDTDFAPKVITIELGSKLPVHAKDYVIPGVGSVDDLSYTINTSEVKIDEVGDYDYTVYHSGVTKRGTISIVDTTPPEVKTKELHIIEGSNYTPESFIVNCLDLSGCEFSFKDEKLANFNEAGLYNKDNNNLIIIVKDPYNNKSEVGVTLYIEAAGDIKKYKKETPLNPSLGYSLVTTYEVHYSSFASNSILSYAKKIDSYTYQDEKNYQEEIKKHEGEKEASFDNKTKTITITDKITNITTNGSNTPQEINDYLISQGFTLIQ